VELDSLSLADTPVAKSTPNHLKLYSEQPPETIQPDATAIASLPGVLEAFQQATGRSLRYIPGPAPAKRSDLPWSTPVTPGGGITPGHLILEAGSSETANANESSTRHLATAIGGILSDTLRLEHALWEREAELAAGVPLVPADDEGRQLARRLEFVLKGGAEAIGCQAAALYLLDEGTSQLKLRSCWGLPRNRLADPARPLRGAVADLEAMLGHAVVLEDPTLMEQWRVPEDFPATVCVPVSTATTILGTLWMFSSQARAFTDPQTNVVEIIAGRVAADLERQMLLNEGIAGARLKRQLAAAEQLQRDQLPSVAPHIDGWDICGWAAQADQLGGTFFDWFSLSDGRLAMALGDGEGQAIESALIAAAVKASLRCHGPHQPDPSRLLAEVDRALWTGSTGGQHAALCYALVDPSVGHLRWSTAGRIGVMAINAEGFQSFTENSSLLGENPSQGFRLAEHDLRPDQVLIIATQGVFQSADAKGRHLGESGLADVIKPHVACSATDLAVLIRRTLETHIAGTKHDDWGILIAKRHTPRREGSS
jgi:serine phosphatase RsbU (regulator of sigma subunit)